MNIKEYKAQRALYESQLPRYRDLCKSCRQPEFSCFCAEVVPFDPQIKFVILMHPIEMKRRIATGRMSHLTLQNSELIVGAEFGSNRQVDDMIGNKKYQPLVLYPGTSALNISSEQPIDLFEPHKVPVIFVIDGTWATARKMMNQSPNLKRLPRICFTPTAPSRFRVRKQPKAECYSTVEAIHHTIELLGHGVGYDVQSRAHDNLLKVFDHMVQGQLRMMREADLSLRTVSYRRPKKSA